MAPMAKGNSIPLTARLARSRVWVQASFLAVWLDPFAIRLHSVCSPVFHCYSCPLATLACPIGVLASFSALHVVPFLAIGTLAVSGALFGSFICGWVCPFGFLQDLVGRIPTRKYELPGWMTHSRYMVLAGLVLIIPYLYGEGHPLFFCRLCPAGAIEAAIPFAAGQVIAGQEVVWPSAAKSIICLLVVAAMLFTWRPWCTLLCPLGAIYGLSNRISFLFLRFQPDECNDCDRCRSLCRYHGPSERRGSDLRCIRCLDCTRCSAVTVATVFGRVERSTPEPDLVTIGNSEAGRQTSDRGGFS